MPGFLLLLTGEGRLLFLSDSVSEHLGHTMVSPWKALTHVHQYHSQHLYKYINGTWWSTYVKSFWWHFLQVDLVAQGDSVYDIIDPTDHYTMRSNLVPPTTPETGTCIMLKVVIVPEVSK